MILFNKVIEDFFLVDIPLKNAIDLTFTWCIFGKNILQMKQRRINGKKICIYQWTLTDGFPISNDWFSKFSNAKFVKVERVITNHILIILQ